MVFEFGIFGASGLKVGFASVLVLVFGPFVIVSGNWVLELLVISVEELFELENIVRGCLVFEKFVFEFGP